MKGPAINVVSYSDRVRHKSHALTLDHDERGTSRLVVGVRDQGDFAVAPVDCLY